MADKLEKQLESVERKISILSRILSIISENGKLSIGRSMLVSCFVLGMIKWANGIDLTESHTTILMVMIGYIFGGKVIGHAKDAIENVASLRTTVKANIKPGKVKEDDDKESY